MLDWSIYAREENMGTFQAFGAEEVCICTSKEWVTGIEMYGNHRKYTKAFTPTSKRGSFRENTLEL